jgi:hypothetical protein
MKPLASHPALVSVTSDQPLRGRVPPGSVATAALAGAVLVAAPLVLGCGGGQTEAKTPERDRGESDQAKVARWMARESPELPSRKVSLFGGLVEGSIEGERAPRIECDPTGAEVCILHTSLGKDSDGDPVSILCTATTETPNFGFVIRKALNGAELTEVPQIEAAPAGPGFAVAFVANSIREDEAGNQIGTAKVKTLYTQNYGMSCFDAGSGNRKSFARIVDKLFASLAFQPNPKRPALLAQGRVIRQGDQIIGVGYTYIEKRSDNKPGTDETSRGFVLETDGSRWSHIDHSSSVLRDAVGGTERATAVFSANGQAPITLTSKAAETPGKLRVKAEIGGKTESIELTPQESLSTEIWSAPQLLRVSRGERPTHKYGTLDINDDREPALAYATLTKKAPGTLEETIQSARQRDRENGDDKNELVLDDDGFVKKQVSEKAIVELAYKWGSLPKEAGAAAAARRSK